MAADVRAGCGLDELQLGPLRSAVDMFQQCHITASGLRRLTEALAASPRLAHILD